MIDVSVFVPCFWKYSLMGCAMIAITYIVGRIALIGMPSWRESDNPFLTTLNSYLMGVLLLSSSFAIIWTAGKTILWLVPVIFLLYWTWNKSHISKISSVDYSLRKEFFCLCYTLILYVVVSALVYFFSFIYSGGHVWGDHVFYANTIHEMFTSHIETFGRFEKATPYHYGDLWWGGLISAIIPVNRVYMLCLIVYPFFGMLVALGINALTERFVTFNSLASGLFYFLSGILILFFWNLSSVFIPWQYVPIFAMPKLYIVVTFILWSVNHIFNKKLDKAFFSLLMLVPIYSPVCAGILTLVCLSSVYFQWREKGLEWHIVFNKYVVGAIFVACLFVLFYLFQPKDNTSLVRIVNDGSVVTSILYYTIKRIFRPFAWTAPWIAVLSFLLCKHNKRDLVRDITYLWMISLLSCLVSILVAGLVRLYVIDGGQIATNFYEPITCCMCAIIAIYLLCLLWKRYSVSVDCLLSGLLIFYLCSFTWLIKNDETNFLYRSFDEREVAVYSALLRQVEATPILASGYFRNYSLPENHNTYKMRYDLSIFCNFCNSYILTQDGYVHPYCLSAFEIPDDGDKLYWDKDKSDLVRYKAKQIYNNVYSNDEQCLSQFILDKSINYIFVEKGAQLPDFLQTDFHKVLDYNEDEVYVKN